LWVIVTVTQREEAIVASAFGAEFDTQCFSRICVAGAKRWQDVPMRDQMRRFFDAYAALQPEDYDVPRKALEAAQ
jgi:hypothetical protein